MQLAEHTSSLLPPACEERIREYKATCAVLGLRQLGGLVAKLHAGFHFGRAGFDWAAACFSTRRCSALCLAPFSCTWVSAGSRSLFPVCIHQHHQLCAAGRAYLVCTIALSNLNAAVGTFTQRGRNHLHRLVSHHRACVPCA